MASTQMQRRTTPSPFGLFPLLARDMDLLQENMRRILQGNQSQGSSAASALPQSLSWVPPVEIRETDDELTISAELAGVDADAVAITIDDDVLTISGVKADERRDTGDNSQYYLVERTYGEFSRSFTLPSTVDPDTVEADFDNGVLNIHLRKRDAARQRGRQIPISTSGGTRSVGSGDAGTSGGRSQRSGAGGATLGSTSGGMVAGSAGDAGTSTGGSASSTSGGGMSASGASSGTSGSAGATGSSGRSGSSRSGKSSSGGDTGMSASSGGSSGSSAGGSSAAGGGSAGSGGSSSGGGRS